MKNSEITWKLSLKIGLILLIGIGIAIVVMSCVGVETEEQFMYLFGPELQYSLDDKTMDKEKVKNSTNAFINFPYDSADKEVTHNKSSDKIGDKK